MLIIFVAVPQLFFFLNRLYLKQFKFYVFLNKLLYLEQFQIHSKIEQKVQRFPKTFPWPPALNKHKLPHYRYPYQSARLLQMADLHGHIVIIQSSGSTLMFSLSVVPFRFWTNV